MTSTNPVSGASKKFSSIELENGVQKAENLIKEGKYQEGIEIMEWAIKNKAKAIGRKEEGRDLVMNFLEGSISDIKNHRPVNLKYLKTYLPVPEKHLRMILKNLPPEIEKLSKKEKVDFIFMALALMHQESRFNPNAGSNQNAIGLMQLQIPTAEETEGQALTAADLKDPATNIRIGLKCLCRLFLNSKGEYDAGKKTFAFTGYNSGGSYIRSLSKKATGKTNLQDLVAQNSRAWYSRMVKAKFLLYKHFYGAEIEKRIS